MKRLDTNTDTYLIKSNSNGYDFIVSMERITNSKNGSPRYRAIVTPLESLKNFGSGWSKVFQVKGYAGARNEAQDLIDKITAEKEA